MLRKFFGASPSSNKSASQRPSTGTARVPRHSSGWGQMLLHFKTEQSLRVLDVGATSSNNINYLTSLGHSIYMADLVEEAAKPQWRSQSPDGDEVFDSAGFIADHMDFAGRNFDAVLLWDAVDYLPEPLVAPVVARLHEVALPGALVLAFFHNPGRNAPQAVLEYNRYHLTDSDQLQAQPVGGYPAPVIYNNRAIERLFADYSGHKFLLAKDNTREIIVTR